MWPTAGWARRPRTTRRDCSSAGRLGSCGSAGCVAASKRRNVMRCYLAATLISVLLLAAIGKLMAQSPEPQKEVDRRPEAQSQPEVLCERTEFGYELVIGTRAFTFNREVTPDDGKKAQPESTYSLSSVTVPAGGWTVDAVAIYTSPSQPVEWLKVTRGTIQCHCQKRGSAGRGGRPPERSGGRSHRS